jgi:hypothetical protein
MQAMARSNLLKTQDVNLLGLTFIRLGKLPVS